MQSGNQTGPINEDDALQAHQQVINDGGAGGVTSGAIGTAAALQTLKGMLGGGGGGQAGGNSFPCLFVVCCPLSAVPR